MGNQRQPACAGSRTAQSKPRQERSQERRRKTLLTEADLKHAESPEPATVRGSQSWRCYEAMVNFSLTVAPRQPSTWWVASLISVMDPPCQAVTSGSLAP